MVCASCKRSNRAGARFCAGCGGSLAARCPACGAETAPDAQFCDACGASLAAAAPAGGDSAGSRKVVTILFADLVGSTSLQERLDAESTRRVMERYYAAMRGPVEAHGGTVVQLLGDGVMCAFGVPNVAEDDAIRAVRAAVGMQQAFREFAREEGAIVGDLGLRIAVNTGEVVTSDERPQGIGDPLNVAGRLQQEAREGDVLLGEATQRLVSEQVTLAHFGTFVLKGRAEPVPAYRVVSLERPAGAPAIAFVGRDEELRRLTSVYEAAVAEPGPRLAAILGSPGLGKSRLLGEFARRLGERATVLTARCDPAGGATFAPLADTLRATLRIDDGASGETLRAAIEGALPTAEPERARIAAGVAGLLAGAPASPEETFFVVRRLLAALAQAQPVVLALDDVQWAEPLLLDLTEHLVQWSNGVPLLVLVAARPELRDTRSSLAARGGLVADVVTLAGLDAGAATRLAANVLGADELPAAIAGRVLATSEGNPLFVGELVRMLVHDGALKREGDRWTTSIALADIEMPPTIHALLAARIERLRPEERTILERAAVIGRQFSRAAVAQLLPREIGDLDARLESLRRSELVEPDTGWFLGEPALRFHHALIRDAAYRRVLRGTRAELHERFADWIAARVGDAIEHDETIGWHLEQAHQQLRELGPMDVKGRALGERAARYLAAAGRRALERDDVPVAGSLLGRALARLDPTDPARADLALDWCEALLAAGQVGPAAGALVELGRFAGDSDRLRAWHTCFVGQLAVLTDPQSLRATADGVEAAAEVLATAGDAAGEAKAHLVHALALQRLGKGGACEAALDRALAAARRVSGHRRLANTVLAGAPLAALWGPSPVTRASGRCLDVVRVLRITQGAPAVEAVALRCQALLEALRGRGDAARRMIASSRRMVEELGLTQQLLETDVFSGHIDLLEGDAVSAERALRGAYAGLREHGLGIDAARAAALLARALLAQGRAAEAETLSGESEALAGDDLQAAIAWRGVRAEALARRGEPARAVEFARAAVEIAAGTDALLHHADARLALATALRAAGRSAEADSEERRAVELWEAKGATTLAEGARRSVAPPVAASSAGTGPPPPTARTRPKVRANAATAHAARLDAVVKARDADALAQLLSDSVEIVHHPTRTELGVEGGVSMLTGLLRADNLSFRNEPLATLGESLVLSYVHSSLTALGGDDVAPFGAIDYDLIAVMEVDGAGRQRRAELFAVDRLGEAIARLYQLRAELLPDGPERARLAATARSVAALPLDGPLDLDRYATAFSADVEWIDYRTVGLGPVRGTGAVVRGIRSLLDLTTELVTRADDVLGLCAEALLVRHTNFGVDRASGGAFERHLIMLWVFGADGLVTRFEQFDVDHEREALARFDERVAARLSSERRVRPNAATANAARVDAAFASKSLDAFRSLFRDDAHAVHHQTGVRYEESQALENYRTLLQAESVSLRYEPLATLGDSLALFQASLSFDSYVQSYLGSVGAADSDAVVLTEVDAAGLRRLTEFFAPDRLADATARLYQRYAEVLPSGPERARAEATARTIPALPLQGPFDPDRYAPALAANVDSLDHRVVGVGAVRGAEVVQRVHRALRDLGDSVDHFEDILGLRPNGLLARRTNSGTDRASGGRFDRPLINLWVFGVDGRVARVEQFDASQAELALARFDELTVPAKLAPRRAQPNAATANVARADAAILARDADAMRAVFADRAEIVHHPTGAVYDEQGSLSNWRSLFEATDLRLATEALATLGDSLALCRTRMSFAEIAAAEADFIGATAKDDYVLVEVDARGRRTRAEVFAVDRLGDAVVRMYERYAETLPRGPARERAVVSARVATALLDPFEADYSTVLARDLVFADHRPLGLGSLHGAEEFVRWSRSLAEMSEHLSIHYDDVLGLRPDMLLVSSVVKGRVRAGGGGFEYPIVHLFRAGADGKASRVEWFEPGQVEEALESFDALEAEPRIENLATRSAAAGTAAMNARDWDRFTAPYRPGFRSSDRRRMVQLELDRWEFLELMRAVFEIGQKTALESLATRGSRLALFHVTWLADNGSVGPSDGEFLMILEVDDAGGTTGSVAFDPDDVDAAYAELDRRFAAGEAAPYAETWEQFWRRSRAVDTRDWDQLAALLPPDLIIEDHRPIRWGVLHSRDEYLAMFRALGDLAPGATAPLEHVLGLDARGVLAVLRRSGSREGGAFEIPVVTVDEVAPDGRVRRLHLYDLEQLDEARACYAALLRPSSVPRFENAATRWADRFKDALEAHDLERLTALHTPNFKGSDRRALMRLDQDRNQAIQSLERLLELRSPRCTWQLIATRGERLALVRALFEFSQDLGGPSEIEWLTIVEVDDAGRRVAGITFDSDALDAAYEELDDRYAAGEAASYARIWEQARQRKRVHESQDWEKVASLHAPELVMEDHRPVGWGTLSRDEYLAMRRSLVELAPDVALRLEHVVALDERGEMLVMRWTGTRAGGPFEIPIVIVSATDANRRVRGIHVFNFEQLEDARACYDALRNESPTPRLENLATRASAVVVAAVQARDWDRFTAVLQPGFRNSDRRRMVQLELDRPQYLESLRLMFEMSRNTEIEVLATRGNRLALFHQSWLASDDLVGPSGGEFLMVIEADDEGGVVGSVLFDADAADAAYAELERRFTLLGARAPRDPLAALARPTLATAAIDRMHAAFEARDWGALRSACAAAARLEDRRSHVLVTLEVEPWMADMRDVFTSPDTRVERRLASTAGERIALERCISRGGAVESAQGPFEIESLWLFEVDAQGLIVSVVLFDPDDWRAAEREAWTRWLAHDTAAAAVHQPIFEMLEAMNARDRARLRAVFAADVVMEDRLRAGPGRIEGVDGYLEWAWSGFDLAPDVQISAFSVARGPYGGVGVMRLRGTLPEGGSFETLRAMVTIVERGLIVRLELFEIEDVEAALARFAELRPDPLRIPATLATRTSDRIPQTFGAGDWDGLAALCAPTMVWDDRRRRSLLVGDRDLFVANIRVVVSQGRRLSKTLLATAGDRLSLHHLHWAGASSDVADFETENLSITEVDAEGRVTAIISFDAEDRRSASAELRERFGRSDGAPYMLSAAFLRALGDHDLAGCRAALPDAFSFHDHRRAGAGAGVLGADEYVAFLGALFEQSPDVQIEPLYYVAVERHGFVSVAHSFGTLADGGPFESVFVQLVTPLGGELFELDDLELAGARFEALRP